MKGLSLIEPYATLVVLAKKTIETREWSTGYRGTVVICASARIPYDYARTCQDEPFATVLRDAGITSARGFRLGRALGTADIVECFRFTPMNVAPLPQMERAFGDFTPGRHGFVFENIVRFAKPVPVRGALGIFDLRPEDEKAVAEQIELNAAANEDGIQTV